jgi:hypothetical protein
LLSNKSLGFEEMQKMRRFSRHWDLVVNSGNFPKSAPLIWSKAEETEADETPSPFWCFMRFSEWVFARMGRNHGIALGALAEMIFEYLTTELKLDPHETANVIYADYERGGRSDKPSALRPYLPETVRPAGVKATALPKRQARHLQAAQAS